MLRTASSTSFDFRKKYFRSQRDATTTRFPCNDISHEDHKKWKVVMFSSLLRSRFLDVRQRWPQRNGCLNPNHIPFPLFREHEVISKFTNHASPFVMERTNHVTVIYHSVKFPAWIRKLPDIAEIPMGETPKNIVESSFKCFICSSASLKNNKIIIFGKSSLDIAGAIRSSLSVDVSRYSGPVYMEVGRS